MSKTLGSLFIAAVVLLGFVNSAIATNSPKTASSLEIVTSDQVLWSQLNPARGDASPQAGQLWGDRKIKTESGFLVKFKDGFSSPPHIHNVGYRGVVISGQIHNDDPDAANFWMSPGSYWTQPAGEVHITSAKGETNIAYIEIDSGPYLVWPAIQAFEDGVRPVNINASNLVWLNASDFKNLIKANPEKPATEPQDIKMSWLWGQPKSGENYGVMLKVPKGLKGDLQLKSEKFRAVVISGEIQISDSAKATTKLNGGNYFGAQNDAAIGFIAIEETILYLRLDGEFIFKY